MTQDHHTQIHMVKNKNEQTVLTATVWCTNTFHRNFQLSQNSSVQQNFYCCINVATLCISFITILGTAAVWNIPLSTESVRNKTTVLSMVLKETKTQNKSC